MSWLEAAQPLPGGWRVLLEELQALLTSLLKDEQIGQRQACLQRAIAVLSERHADLSDTPREIDFQLYAGRAYENLGAWEQALAAYRRAELLAARLHFLPQQITALRWISNVLSRQNRWQEAVQACEQSLALAQQSGDESAEAHAHNTLGIIAFEQGDFEQAAARWETALELAEKVHAHNLVAVIFNNRGALANVQGRWQEALASYSESLPRFETTGDLGSMASTYHNLAMSYADHGDWPQASIYYEKSFRLAQQAGDLHLQTSVRLNRVELYLAIGDLPFAEELCRQVLQTYQQLHDHLGEADACKFLGIINTRKRAWARAKSYFERSIRLALQYHHPLGEAEARWEYARMLQLKGPATLAREQYEQALALFQKVEATIEIARIKEEMAAWA
ncbi:MAG: tetratricopeptide repeat protein [candidate division KSB1 bacterium]|nr:tetratricopeptide repeat protein [candidate division KSB1 bacterium]MDZ7274530.1 tetratricopeptide repeat protein [candidate division KSB1 bacterium]MDZ7284809.1 tetratricopeptide repeat protein [candidate division KSB1 bacterium]MDZ7297771.1 tetratricopeptide repeat protein [candidate division KSB1 bacterium]MDZ7306440.1 tetratricopeptide repeat protein [candidate division KSB1 bacterium]